MNVVKRAIASVIRKPGKTAILLVIIFILGNIIAGAVSVRQAVENAELTLRAKMSPVTAIGYDDEKFVALQTQNPEFKAESLSVETIEKIGASSYVKVFDYSTMLSLETPALKRYSASGNQAAETPSYFTFTGVNNPKIVDMQEGMIRLVSGRVFNEEEIKNLTYVALISQEVASINNLAVGSVITFEDNIFNLRDNVMAATQKYNFEIIGIFEPVKQSGKGNGGGYEEWENRIYTSNRVLNEAAAFQTKVISKWNPKIAEVFKDTLYSTVYVLNDPMYLEPFREEVATLVPDYYTVKTSESFDQVAAPIRSIQGIASLVLYIAVGAAVLIMSLLITLFLRDRRREIGIYLSLGERKIKIAGQIFLEVAVVAVIAITLSLLSGNMLSSGVSEKMLADQIVAEQANMGGDRGNYGFLDLGFRGYQGVVSSEDIASSYAVSLDMITVLLFYVIGFGTVCVSVLVPIFYVTRLNPKKILMGV